MRVLTVLLFALMLLPAAAECWSPEVSERLREGAVVNVALLQDSVENWEGSNPYLLLTLEGGLRAVFRSEDEPWGSVAELGGYNMDCFLGTELVPPTVERTFEKDQWPAQWPWESAQRSGTLQLFVDGARPASRERLSKDDWANAEILGFVMGRYDNHSGNLLRDPQGRAVMIDFEGSLDLQKVRYGDFPFIKRGGWHHSPDTLSAEEPFPFDNPRKLVNPDLQEIENRFGPWWGQIWPQGMKHLARLVKGIPEGTIPYALWGDRLWVQIRVRSRHAYHTDHYPRSTMERLKQLDSEALKGMLGEPFREVHSRQILDRRDQLLRASSGIAVF